VQKTHRYNAILAEFFFGHDCYQMLAGNWLWAVFIQQASLER
jgi:hypothetical protein